MGSGLPVCTDVHCYIAFRSFPAERRTRQERLVGPPSGSYGSDRRGEGVRGGWAGPRGQRFDCPLDPALRSRSRGCDVGHALLPERTRSAAGSSGRAPGSAFTVASGRSVSRPVATLSGDVGTRARPPRLGPRIGTSDCRVGSRPSAAARVPRKRARHIVRLEARDRNRSACAVGDLGRWRL